MAILKLSQKEKKIINSRFSENALKIMKKRYLLTKEDGTEETPADMFARVAVYLAEVEENYGKDKASIEKIARDFFEVMANKEYAPAGRTLANAGAGTPLVANCIVLPIHDSMESIFQTLKEAALLQQAGSGLGFDFSELRPADFPTKRSRGRASGPVSFLQVYNAAFGTIKQQGRHGANMAIMRVDHPDILDFIRCKRIEGEMRNFNITVTVTDEFMKQLEKNPNKQWWCNFGGKKMKPRKVLRHPNGSVYAAEEVNITVKELFDELVEHTWLNGEPGIAFIDTINRANPLPGLGPISACNPCGEQYLHPYDNCNLGSVNLAAFVKNKKINWPRLRFVVRTAVRLMDNVIDRFDFPVPQVTELAQKNRRIGLGVMGFADMLYQLGIKYNSKAGLAMAEKVMGFIQKEAHLMSQELAEEKGVFPNYNKSIFAKKKIKMRNAALTTVAPTGSISMIYDVSSGMEPNFALSYIKQDKDGHQYHYFNRYFEEALNHLKLSAKEKDKIMEETVKRGSIQHLKELPEKLREIFVIAMDIPGIDHVRMQAAFQRHVDNSISKTINFPNTATREEIAESFIAAWKLGCKSITAYRDGSRTVQILNIGTGEGVVAPTEVATGATGNISQLQPIAQLPTTSSSAPTRPEAGPRTRPEVMSGKTYRIRTGYGNLYVTINNDGDGRPFEMFATIGKSGGFFQEQSEAICRLVSLALRSGISVEHIIDHLKGIRGPMPVLTEKGTILSLPDALGKILAEHVGLATNNHNPSETSAEKQAGLPFSNVSKSIADFGFMPGCPECGSPLEMQEGCITCKSCGFSRCF